MYAQFYNIRLLVDAVIIGVNLYSIGLWIYAWMRFGSLSFMVLAVASVGAFFLALVVAAFAYDVAGMKRLDPTHILYGFSYFVVQPCLALTTIIGQTLLVRWLIRTRTSDSPRVTE